MLLNRISTSELPVGLPDIAEHLRAPDDDVGVLEAIRRTAHDMVAEMSGRTLSTETWDLSLDAVSGDVLLPRSPVQSLVSITFFDAAGTPQAATLTDFDLFKDRDRAIVRPKVGKSWPGLQTREDALTIRFVAGYTELPQTLNYAVRLCAEGLFDRNMPEMQPTIETMVGFYRIGWIAG